MTFCIHKVPFCFLVFTSMHWSRVACLVGTTANVEAEEERSLICFECVV